MRIFRPAVTAVACFSVIATLGLTSPAWAAEYPSWDDVRAAQGSESTKQREITNINSILTELSETAGTLGNAAVAATTANDIAQQNLHKATTDLERIAAELQSAQTDLAEKTQVAGTIASLLAKQGANGLLSAQLITSDSPTDLLSELGSLERITALSAQAINDATQAENTVSSLASQSNAAQNTLNARARVASAAEQSASDASSSADQAVLEAESQQGVLYEQLALLKDTTAAIEEEYREGEQARAAYEAQQAEAERRAAEQATQTESPPPSSGSSNTTPGSGSATSPPTTTPPPATVGGMSPAQAQSYASTQMAGYGWDQNQMQCLTLLWNRESGWRYTAQNPSSGAYGIPQSLPGSKMESSGFDWRTNAATQINWGLGYISGRYGNPCGAWAHSESHNWY